MPDDMFRWSNLVKFVFETSAQVMLIVNLKEKFDCLSASYVVEYLVCLNV